MAKYDWKQLEKEYILSNYKSVSAFLRGKGIKTNSSNRKQTVGWKEKRDKNVAEKGQKTIKKVTEKESEKEAQQIIDIKSIANDLALNIIKANKEVNKHIAKSKKKIKKVKYDSKALKPSEETIEEIEEIKDYISIIDRQGLKMLASALKDLNEILIDKQESNNKDLNNAKEILVKIKEVANNDRNN